MQRSTDSLHCKMIDRFAIKNSDVEYLMPDSRPNIVPSFLYWTTLVTGGAMCLRADTRSQEASTRMLSRPKKLLPPPLEKNLERLEKAASTEVRLTQDEGDCGMVKISYRL